MELAIPAFLAGVLTILAPCILPLLPIIVGGSVTGKQHKLTPFVITGSLVVSVVVFTLLIRASTLLIDIPLSVWAQISGGAIILLGLVMLLPHVWERVSLKFNIASNKLLGKSAQQEGWTGSILTGAALGPVFTSCSPTYAFILFSVIPQEQFEGFILLVLYAVGLGIMLLATAFLGRRFTKRLQGLSSPTGWFKRTMGIIFIIVGLAIFTGYDKRFETWLLDQGFYNNIAEFELNAIEKSEVNQ